MKAFLKSLLLAIVTLGATWGAAPAFWHSLALAQFPANVTAPPLVPTGSELVTDGNLATDPTLSGWTLHDNTWSVGQISGTLTNVVTGDMRIDVPVTVTSGQWYQVQIVGTVTGDAITAYASDSSALKGASSGAVSPSGSQTYTWAMYASGSGATSFVIDMNYYLTNGATWLITSVSFKAITDPTALLVLSNYQGFVTLSTLGPEYLGTVALGRNTLPFGSNGQIAIGGGALSVGGGPRDIAVGVGAMQLSPGSSAGYSVALGFDALIRNQGNFNVAIGSETMYTTTTGTNDTAIGPNALYACTTCSNILAAGTNAGTNVTTSIDDVILGQGSGATLTTGNNDILIGFQADVPLAATSNYLNIGGVITGDMSAGPIIVAKAMVTPGITLTATAPSTTSGQVSFGSTTAASSNCGSLSGSAGCLVVNIAGTTHYVPYW